MYPELMPATEEHEQAVGLLFSEAGLVPPVAAWERDLSPANPMAGAPWIVVRGDAVLAFVEIHPCRVCLDGGMVEAATARRYLATYEEGWENIRRLVLETLVDRWPLVLAAGWSAEGVAHLRAHHWAYLGPWQRLRFSVKAIESKVARPTAGGLPPVESVARVSARMVAEHRIVMDRPTDLDEYLGCGAPGELHVVGDAEGNAGWLRVVDAAGAPGRDMAPRREWHLVDARLPAALWPLAAERLETLARATGRDVYVSLPHRESAALLEARNWQRLAPRWGTFAHGGGAASEGLRKLGPNPEAWFTAVDFGLDMPLERQG